MRISVEVLFCTFKVFYNTKQANKDNNVPERGNLQSPRGQESMKERKEMCVGLTMSLPSSTIVCHPVVQHSQLGKILCSGNIVLEITLHHEMMMICWHCLIGNEALNIEDLVVKTCARLWLGFEHLCFAFLTGFKLPLPVVLFRENVRFTTLRWKKVLYFTFVLL